MKSCACAARAAASICASVRLRPIAMFSRALAASRKGSCGTTPTLARKCASAISPTGVPSMRMLPAGAG